MRHHRLGLLRIYRDLSAEAATLDAMTGTMACRGPDDRGVWADGPTGLGHRRLAIIDLPGGRQPMTAATPRGTVPLVHSGEAYNFAELRGELTARGHRFTTGSDTESSCAATSNGATPSPSASTACTPSPSGTAAATGSY